jgi:hypothetical protein
MHLSPKHIESLDSMYNLTTFPVTSPLSHLGFGEFYDEKGLPFL